MITYLAIFAVGAVLGALATLCVVDSLLLDIEPFVPQDDIDEIRRRYESECE